MYSTANSSFGWGVGTTAWKDRNHEIFWNEQRVEIHQNPGKMKLFSFCNPLPIFRTVFSFRECRFGQGQKKNPSKNIPRTSWNVPTKTRFPGNKTQTILFIHTFLRETMSCGCLIVTPLAKRCSLSLGGCHVSTKVSKDSRLWRNLSVLPQCQPIEDRALLQGS